MDKIRITGGQQLNGDIEISGAKNAALPLMVAAILTDQPLVLNRVPELQDVLSLNELLEELGVSAKYDGVAKKLTLHGAKITSTEAPYEFVRKMRASILVLGPLVARMGVAKVSLPGGCAIGTRPVDLHIEGLKRLGAEIELNEGYILAKAPNGLVGAPIHFTKVSVGATENLMMAAALAKGTTVLTNAAREPDVVDLCTMLSQMGAQIEGAGTSTMTITGVPRLHPTEHRVIGDRIVAATWGIAAAMTQGDISVTGVDPAHLQLVLHKLHDAGATVTQTDDGFRVVQYERPRAANIATLPFPGFPTDLQPMAIAIAAIAEGTSMITENVFEARFRFVEEMVRLGADARTDGHHAVVRGIPQLSSAPVWSSDIRAGAGLVLAALVADGETEVHDVFHIDRGYPLFVENLTSLGAEIERVH